MRKILICFTMLAAASVFAGCESAETKKSAPGPLASMQIMPEKTAMFEGDSIELSAIGFDAAKIVLQVSPKWKQLSGSKAGRLDAPKVSGSKAIFRAFKEGQASIEIEQNGIKATKVITVTKTPKAMSLRNDK